MSLRTYTAMIYKNEAADARNPFHAECLELGTIGEGRSKNEAMKALMAETQSYLQANPTPYPRDVVIESFVLQAEDVDQISGITSLRTEPLARRT